MENAMQWLAVVAFTATFTGIPLLVYYYHKDEWAEGYRNTGLALFIGGLGVAGLLVITGTKGIPLLSHLGEAIMGLTLGGFFYYLDDLDEEYLELVAIVFVLVFLLGLWITLGSFYGFDIESE